MPTRSGQNETSYARFLKDQKIKTLPKEVTDKMMDYRWVPSPEEELQLAAQIKEIKAELVQADKDFRLAGGIRSNGKIGKTYVRH